MMQSTTAIETTHHMETSYAFQFESYYANDNRTMPYVWSTNRHAGHFCRGVPSNLQLLTLHEIDLVLKLPTNLTDEDENYCFLVTVTSLKDGQVAFISQLDWIEEEALPLYDLMQYSKTFGYVFVGEEDPKMGYIPPSTDMPNLWSSVGRHVGKSRDELELHEIDLVLGLPINQTDEDKHHCFVLTVTSRKDGEEERIFIEEVDHWPEDAPSPPSVAEVRGRLSCSCKSREEHYKLCGGMDRLLRCDDLIKA